MAVSLEAATHFIRGTEMKIENMQPGQQVWSVQRHKMGNTTITTVSLYPVRIVSVDLKERTVTASWNGNPQRVYREADAKKWSKDKPETVNEHYRRRAAETSRGKVRGIMAQFVLVKESAMFRDVAERVSENVTMPVCRVNRHSKGEYNLQLILAAPRMRDLLQAIVGDLPNNRDWLDPSIEREAVELLTALKWHDKGSGQPVAAVPRSHDNAMPSDKMTPLVEVFHTGNDGEWHIIGFSGNVSGGLFEYIEQEFKDEQEWWKEQLSNGPGSYLFEAEFVPEQRDDFGRIELSSYWCLTRVAFRAL